MEKDETAVPVEQAIYTLLNESLLLHNAADKHILAQHGLRRARYYILHHLYHEPHITLGQLSELTLIYSASASRIVYSMEKEGLVQRATDEKDRRSFTLSLTAAGQSFYKKVNADLAADVQERFQPLDPAAKTDLLTHCQRLRDLLREHTQRQEGSARA